MMDILGVLDIIKMILFASIILLNLIYIIPILLIRRFRRRKYIFTVNICAAVIGCSLYYTIFFIIHDHYTELFLIDRLCNWLLYMRLVSSWLVSSSFIIISVNRYISMRYYSKAFFKSKQWVIICIISQWILAFLISLPLWSRDGPYCYIPQWISIYILLMTVVVPSGICLVINIQVFLSVHSLSQQIQPSSIATPVNTNQIRKPRICRSDIRLLLHTIFMFSIFVLGWGPISIVTAADYNSQVPSFVYTLLVILVQLSFLCDIFNLFCYNQTLRYYLIDKILRFC